jgi:hypothetical protein
MPNCFGTAVTRSSALTTALAACSMPSRESQGSLMVAPYT